MATTTITPPATALPIASVPLVTLTTQPVDPTAVRLLGRLRATAPAALGDRDASTTVVASYGAGAGPNLVSIAASALDALTVEPGSISFVRFRALCWHAEPATWPPPGMTDPKMSWTVAGVPHAAAIANESGDPLYASWPIRHDDDGVDAGDPIFPDYFVRAADASTQPDGTAWTLEAVNALADVGVQFTRDPAFPVDLAVAEVIAEVFGFSAPPLVTRRRHHCKTVTRRQARTGNRS